jgi:anti-sigma factor RsiW
MKVQRHQHPLRVDAWLDGELPEAASVAVEQHVASCPSCGEHARVTRVVTEALGVEPLPLADGVLARLTEGTLVADRPLLPLWWVALPTPWRLGLAALLLVGVGSGFGVSRALVPAADPITELAEVMGVPELEVIATAVTAQAHTTPSPAVGEGR